MPLIYAFAEFRRLIEDDLLPSSLFDLALMLLLSKPAWFLLLLVPSSLLDRASLSTHDPRVYIARLSGFASLVPCLSLVFLLRVGVTKDEFIQLSLRIIFLLLPPTTASSSLLGCFSCFSSLSCCQLRLVSHDNHRLRFGLLLVFLAHFVFDHLRLGVFRPTLVL